MLEQIAEDVLVRRSAFCLSNTVVVIGPHGALVVDAGIHAAELVALAAELAARGLAIQAAFSTHPHWDHLLWHPSLGDVPRYGTHVCVEHAATHLEDARGKAARLADAADLDLLGRLQPLPPDEDHVPWDGPAVRVIEHRAHAPGHAALFTEGSGVLIAGDMLSDVEMPLLDLRWSTDPAGDYHEGLRRLDAAEPRCRAVVPGHGHVGTADDLRERLSLDRAYLAAIAVGRGDDDPRLDPALDYGADWLRRDHDAQVAWLAAR